MTEELYNVIDWADVEEILYADSSNPKRILGAHLIDEGLLVQAFIPTAEKVELLIEGEKYEMELADENGFYAVLIKKQRSWKKKLPDYTLNILFDNGETIETEDPYMFKQILKEEELNSFSAGINYEIYKKLGSHICEIDGVLGVYFALWAPNAERVSVVGDFNLWDGRRHMMEKLGDTGVFELFIPKLEEGMLYKYEIKRRLEEPIVKPDPYADHFENAPKDASIISDRDNFKWTDDKWEEDKKTYDIKKAPVSIYEVDLATFKAKKPVVNEDGSKVLGSEFYNYRELAKEIASYVKKEGYTHIKLMPIMEYLKEESQGYQTCGYYAPSSRYGEPKDFKFFINHMHKNGIGVILDWVMAYLPENDWLAYYDGAAVYEPADYDRALRPCSPTLNFDYSKPEVSNFLIANALYWSDEYHIDGLQTDSLASILYLNYGRLDGSAPRNIYGGNENLDAVEFIKHLNSVYHKKNEGCFIIAKDYSAWPQVTAAFEDGGLGFDLKWNNVFSKDFTTYMKCDPFFRKNNYNQLTFSMIYNYAENFTIGISHNDVTKSKQSFFAKLPGQTMEEKAENMRTAYGYIWAHPGKKYMFMGQDFGQYDAWSKKTACAWNLLKYPVHENINKYVKDLNQVYKKHPALYEMDYDVEGFEWINCSYSDLSLAIFVRKTENPDETIFVVSNFDNMEHIDFRVGVPFPCNIKAIISSDDKKYGGTGLVKRYRRKSRKIEWDDREDSVVIDIPAMSTVVYSLKSLEAEEKKEEKKKEKKEDKKVKKASKKSVKNSSKKKAKSKPVKKTDNLKKAKESKSKAKDTLKKTEQKKKTKLDREDIEAISKKAMDMVKSFRGTAG